MCWWRETACPAIREGWAVVSNYSGLVYRHCDSQEEADSWCSWVRRRLEAKGCIGLIGHVFVVRAPAYWTRFRPGCRSWKLKEYFSPAWVEYPATGQPEELPA